MGCVADVIFLVLVVAFFALAFAAVAACDRLAAPAVDPEADRHTGESG